MIAIQYQVGGSLTTKHPSYVVRQSDTDLYNALKAGEFCYVLNSRQMGKSSMMVRTRDLLVAKGYCCATIDMTRFGHNNLTAVQWYKGLVEELWRGCGFSDILDFNDWWRDEEDVPPLQQLSNFIEDILLAKLPGQDIVIFVDEVDSVLSLDFSVDDFFGLIRFCYNQRAINPEYNRLSFAIFGVATPSDLMNDRQRTPFNIGQSIELTGFSLLEAQPLAKGLVNPFGSANAILKVILEWTDGQPFLTQKLCRLMVDAIQTALQEEKKYVPMGSETAWVESVVKSCIIQNWESQDEPEHLRTIRDRLQNDEQKMGRILGLYQQILDGAVVNADDGPEHTELQLSGLVVKQNGVLSIRNPIYQAIFTEQWVERNLSALRPYSQAFAVWVKSGQTDKSRLLRGQALKDAQAWSSGKSLGDLDYQFLTDSEAADRQETQQRLEAERTQEVEARLESEQKALATQLKNSQLQRGILAAVGGALVIATVLGIASFSLYRRASESQAQAVQKETETAISQISSQVRYSQALFALDKRLDALQEAIRATRQVSQLKTATPEVQAQVELALRQAVYGAIEQNRLSDHKAPVYNVAYSPTGEMIASASWDKTARLWRPDGSLVTVLKGHTGPVWGVTFSPDGKMVATASEDKTIKLWDDKGELLQTIEGHTERVNGVAFTADGNILVSGGGDGKIKLWQLDGTAIRTIDAHDKPINHVQIGPDGTTIASASDDRSLKLWNLDGTQLRSLKGHSAGVSRVAFSPDGKYLSSVSDDKTVNLWTIDGLLLDELEGHGDRVWGVTFSPDSQMLASASWDSTIKLWKLDGTLLNTLSGHGAGAWSLAFSPDGKKLVSSSEDTTVRIWNLDETLIKTLRGHDRPVIGVAFSPDGNNIASASWDKTVRLWSDDGRLKRTLKGHADRVWQMAFSPDSSMIASASWDKTVKLWKVDGSSPAKTITGHIDRVWGVTFSPDGQTIASASWDKTIKLWNLDGELLKTFRGHNDRVYGVAFSPDGRTLASGSWDTTVKLWNLDGEEIRTLEGHRAPIWGIEYSPNGQMLASASVDGTVKLWTRDGEPLSTLEGHVGRVNDVTFHPNSQLVATSGVDQTVKIWQTDGTLITTLNGHSGPVWHVNFSPDGQSLVSGGADTSVILWDWDQALELDEVLNYGCQWLGDYLTHNSGVAESDRQLCSQ
ncbi:MAG: AAA-like domain-containing protein [Cyanobacteria bacterium P01_F01_bin.150]